MEGSLQEEMPAGSTVAALTHGGPAARRVAEQLSGRVRPEPSGCQVWTGGCTGVGMPAVTVAGRKEGVPRLVWTLLYGPPPAGRMVTRACGNSLCVAVEHLRLRAPGRAAPTVDRVLAGRVRVEGDCWRWSGGHTRPEGYGTIQRGGAQLLAHRWVWQELVGPIRAVDVVAHRCPHRDCVRPEHLYLTDPSTHAQEVTAQGRRPAGEDHWHHLLTWDQVHQIRVSTDTVSVLAGRYGVARSTITSIRTHQRWTRDTNPR